MPELPVSVIICCYTDERLQDIREAVASVQQQTRPPGEIIVAVDNNPALFELLKGELGGQVRVVLNDTARGLSATRNGGIAAAQGDLVAFLDDDATAEADWLEKLLVHFESSEVCAVGGRAELRWVRGRPSWFPEELDWVVGGSFTWIPQMTTEVANPHGHNMCFRREAFNVAGLFNEAMGRRGWGGQAGEEREFCLRLKERLPQARIIYEPSARIQHKVPARRGSWTYLLKRSFGEGSSKACIGQSSRSAKSPVATESHYLNHLILDAIPSRLLRFWSPSAMAQVLATLVCIAATTVGYGAGRLRTKFSGVKFLRQSRNK